MYFLITAWSRVQVLAGPPQRPGTQVPGPFCRAWMVRAASGGGCLRRQARSLAPGWWYGKARHEVFESFETFLSIESFENFAFFGAFSLFSLYSKNFFLYTLKTLHPLEIIHFIHFVQESVAPACFQIQERGPHRCSPHRSVFGRRGVLLHLSGLPCQYHRRVAATKLTTSNTGLILCIV